ncbi:MAG: tetratricopeptide repeat protein [Candidatus Zixiibacteriota bacterium]
MIAVPGLKIAGPLGKGGTAEVAKAHSTELNKDVAIKYPLFETNESTAQFQKLAEREITLIGNLKSPGVVNVLQHSQNPPYLLLELCNGQSLEKLGKVEEPEMLFNIISSLAANLEFLRLNKLIHCDLKPQNVFLPSDFPLYENGKLFFTKISDFSLGRFTTEPESARAGHGTVGFAAPETLKLGKTSHQADLFALGVIAYQLAAGQHPFFENDIDPVKIESRIQENEPAPLNKIRRDLPPEFCELLNSLLAKDEQKRPRSAWEVCQVLNKCGCRHPYAKVISPSFLIKSHDNFDSFVDEFLEITDKQKERLLTLTASRPEYLRLILWSNFANEILYYNGEKFAFRTNIYWPAYLRRKALNFFSKARTSDKKKLVEAAASGQRLATNDAPPGTTLLISHLLSPGFTKIHSLKIAKELKSKNNFHGGAIQFLKAGRLEEAIKCTEIATKELKDAKSSVEAVHLINRVSEFAKFIGREFDIRQLLMTKGDIERAGGDVESAINTYNKIVELYNGMPADKLLAETYRNLGDICKTKQKFNEGINVLNKALAIYRELNDDLLTSRALNKIGELYRIAADLGNSLKYLRQALLIQRRLGAVADAAVSLNSIAIIYGTKGRLKRAISILSISLKMKRTLDDQGEIARTLNNLGLAHHLCGDFKKSQTFLNESLAINRQIGSKREIFSNLLNLSESMMKFGDLGKALVLVKEVLDLGVALNLKPHQAHILKTMGGIYQKMNHFSESENCYAQSLRLVEEIDDRVLKIRLLINQSELRSELGDTQKAVSLAEQALRESVSLKADLEELQSLIILVGASGKLELLSRAKAIVEKLNLNRERLMLEFAYLQFLLDINAISDLKLLFAPLEMQLAKMSNDIEYPKLLNVAGEILISWGDREKAVPLLSESKQIAQSKNLVSEVITCHILEGKISFEDGNYEKAYGSYRTALQLCKSAALTIASNEDKLTFMKKPKMLFLANQIRQLNEKMGSKQKAGV